MTGAVPTTDGDAEVDLRRQLSSMQGLLVLAMLMTERGDPAQILHLTATSVPSLGSCRLAGVHLDDEGWMATSGACDDTAVRIEVEAQFAVLTSAGGAVAVRGEGWAWAFPMRSLGGNFGHLVVSADGEPPAGTQFLLRVLAQQTGIALANARLHARERASATEFRVANAELASTVRLLERSTEIHDRLTRVAMRGEGQEGIARAVHDLTGYPVAVEDQYGNLRAWAGPGRPEPYPKAAAGQREELLIQAKDAAQPIRHGDRLMAVATPDGDVLGVLALIDPAESAGASERVALEHGATVLAMELARLLGVAEAELRVGRDLVDQLLSGTENERAVLARAQVLGYDLERSHRVVVVQFEDRDTQGDVAFQAVRRAARDLGLGSLLATRNGGVVVLADASLRWESFRSAVVEHARGRACRVGVGGPCAGPGDVPRSYHEAMVALRLQTATGGDNRATSYEDLGVYRVLAEAHDAQGVERFVLQWLGDLLEYDTTGRADLVATVSQYLESGRSHEAAAAALSVHRSTLKYRLQRIGEVSGLDLSDPDTAFNLQLATRAWATLEALRGEPPQR